MGCAVVEEVPDLLLGALLISGFFSRKGAVMYRSPYALSLSTLFIGAGLAEMRFGPNLDVFEFLGALGIMFMIERFISVNTGEGMAFRYPIMVAALAAAVVIIEGNLRYFRVGVLFTLSTVAIRLRAYEDILGWSIESPLIFSAASAILSAAAFLAGLEVVSAFLYLGTVMFFILTLAEKAGGWTA